MKKEKHLIALLSLFFVVVCFITTSCNSEIELDLPQKTFATRTVPAPEWFIMKGEQSITIPLLHEISQNDKCSLQLRVSWNEGDVNNPPSINPLIDNFDFIYIKNHFPILGLLENDNLYYDIFIDSVECNVDDCKFEFKDLNPPSTDATIYCEVPYTLKLRKKLKYTDENQGLLDNIHVTHTGVCKYNYNASNLHFTLK